MLIQPHTPSGVRALLFVLKAETPFDVALWSEAATVMTGVSADEAFGRALSDVMDVEEARLARLARARIARLPGVGLVVAERRGNFLFCRARTGGPRMHEGLADQEARAPLRAILSLAEEARRDVFSAEACLVRIARIAREGLAADGPGAQRVDRAREFAGADWVDLRTLCDEVCVQVFHDVPAVVVQVDRRVLRQALKVLGPGASQVRDGDAPRYGLSVTVDEPNVLFAFPYPAGGTSGRGQGLLALRNLAQASGGSLRLADGDGFASRTVLLTLPGALLTLERTGPSGEFGKEQLQRMVNRGAAHL